jgi:hypothetical protein
VSLVLVFKDELQEGVLYEGYGEGRILKEYSFASLENGETIEWGTLHETNLN